MPPQHQLAEAQRLDSGAIASAAGVVLGRSRASVVHGSFGYELALCHAFKFAETGNDNKAIALSGGLAKLSFPEEEEKRFVGLEAPSLLFEL
ncbi:hypothetical protein ACET3Z_024225 [Daucus carota]